MQTATLGEIRRGANLDNPGLLFSAYNWVAAPDLAERFGALLWYRPYRAFPNDVNALPESYRQRVLEIAAIESRR